MGFHKRHEPVENPLFSSRVIPWHVTILSTDLTWLSDSFTHNRPLTGWLTDWLSLTTSPWLTGLSQLPQDPDWLTDWLTTGPWLSAFMSLLPFVQGSERGLAPCRRSGTFSSPSRITWRLKSVETSWACMTLSPRMNSSVILATSTQVASGYYPRPAGTHYRHLIRFVGTVPHCEGINFMYFMDLPQLAAWVPQL
jgi:hypothetical protein